MDLTLNFVSTLCWEIITTQKIRLDHESLPVFKPLLESVYDFSPTIFEQNLRIYWRYSQEGFLEVNSYFSFYAFLNLMVEPNLYLIIGDAVNIYKDTEKFLKILDLMELQQIKAKNRNKYDLRCEADEIGEEIQKRQESLDAFSNSEDRIIDDRDILRFALRKMPMGRCYTANICSGYKIIDCVRKGWPATKKILVPLPDEVLERKVKKDKGKPDKKGSEKKVSTEKKSKKIKGDKK